jgi:SAM-dependent methyltransferase
VVHAGPGPRLTGRRAAIRRPGSQLVALARGYPTRALRRAVAEGDARWIARLPMGLRRRLDLDGGAIDPLRVEIGGGPFPSPGYVHVDADRRSRHLEHIAPAWRLPFADGTVEEILAVHVLEHVHAADVDRTLREWRRVLGPGGYAEIHVPNAATVFPAFLSAPPEKKWALMIAIYGMPCHPASGDDTGAGLDHHKIIYDFALLERVLLDAGFDQVTDVTDTVTDRHNEGWRQQELVSRVSLIVRATPGAPSGHRPGLVR